jgi:hypothetical protein
MRAQAELGWAGNPGDREGGTIRARDHVAW